MPKMDKSLRNALLICLVNLLALAIISLIGLLWRSMNAQITELQNSVDGLILLSDRLHTTDSLLILDNRVTRAHAHEHPGTVNHLHIFPEEAK